MKIRNKIIIGALGISLFSGSVGVYAGTVIEAYKTARGNIATVEQEHIHKNRIGITVNGEKISKDTWYAHGVTYAPMRDVAELLGASVNYNSSTQSADIVTESKLLDLLGLEIQRTYYGLIDTYAWSNQKFEFKITNFNPSTQEFKGEIMYRDKTYQVVGTISETKIIFKDKDENRFELYYNGADNYYSGKWRENYLDVYFSLD